MKNALVQVKEKELTLKTKILDNLILVSFCVVSSVVTTSNIVSQDYSNYLNAFGNHENFLSLTSKMEKGEDLDLYLKLNATDKVYADFIKLKPILEAYSAYGDLGTFPTMGLPGVIINSKNEDIVTNFYTTRSIVYTSFYDLTKNKD